MQTILNRPSRALQMAAAMFPLVAFAAVAQADIFQWEYINPADPSQGKRQSMTLAPDGAGVNALPDADLSYRNLTMAYLIGTDVRNASFRGGMLTDADFTNADVRGANFNASYCSGSTGCFRIGTGLTPVQLYATASYQSGDLSGINFEYNNLAGGNFVGQNLTNADLEAAALTDADFTDAKVQDADFGSALTLVQLYSTASYLAGDLSGISLRRNDLAAGNFAGQNVTNANFAGATLTGADFTGAKLQGASFARPLQFGGEGGPFVIGTGITLTQLYSTASYLAHDLSGINVIGNDLAGGNFISQNLTNAVLGGLAGVDLTAADVRGAVLNPGVMATNLILPDGQIKGLDLEADGLIVVRDYDGNPIAYPAPVGRIPITVEQHFTMGAGGTLRMVFDADPWDSTISFAPGIPVTLGGTLELVFADDVNLATQLGRTFDLFDWTGINPIGVFAVSSPYAWDISNLYTTGEVTLTGVPEPNSMFLLGVGLAAAIAMRRNDSRKNRSGLRFGAVTLVTIASAAQADIYQWEYINPGDPSQGKRPSAMLAPDGAGVDAKPGANLSRRDLTKAYLVGSDLSGVQLGVSILTDADISHANLTNTNLYGATLTDADFTDAEVRGASFDEGLFLIPGPGEVPLFYRTTTLGSGISPAQLYSTASYQAHDLTGIDLSRNSLAGANFVNQNITDASFYGALLTEADFTGAEVRGATFGRPLGYVRVIDPILLPLGTGLSIEQIYSTANYQARDLSGIDLSFNDLVGADFAGQNLANASFYGARVEAADFTGADVRGASFDIIHVDDEVKRFPSRTFFFGSGISLAQLYTTASYQERDIRGVSGIGDAIPTIANLILSNGHILGLDLDADGLLVVRDYDGNPMPIPITIDQHLAIGRGGALRMVFEADAWDSTISFAPGIPVALGGTLELTFAVDVNLASQVGRTFDLFDWTGVSPTGTFSVASPYGWNLSNLYTTGEVTLTAVPEPASLLPFLVGLIAMFSRQRAIKS